MWGYVIRASCKTIDVSRPNTKRPHLPPLPKPEDFLSDVITCPSITFLLSTTVPDSSGPVPERWARKVDLLPQYKRNLNSTFIAP